MCVCHKYYRFVVKAWLKRSIQGNNKNMASSSLRIDLGSHNFRGEGAPPDSLLASGFPYCKQRKAGWGLSMRLLTNVVHHAVPGIGCVLTTPLVCVSSMHVCIHKACFPSSPHLAQLYCLHCTLVWLLICKICFHQTPSWLW